MLKNFIKNIAKEPEPIDIELVPTGDFHTGGTTALHPNIRKDKTGKYRSLTDLGGWYYSDKPNFHPSSLQIRIWEHLEKCLDIIAERRKGKKLLFLSMADMIDGKHHDTSQLITRHVTEQASTNREMMVYILDRLNFHAGDSLLCLQGTEVHVGIVENEIAKELGAMEFETGVYVSPHIDIVLNGVRVWAWHKGVSAGQGQTRGNACINKLKQVYYQCLQDNVQIPEIIITAHTHDAHHATWTRPDGKTMHYFITAPWQDKTRFAFDNLATNKNKVGIQTITIKADGKIIANDPILMASPLGHTVEL